MTNSYYNTALICLNGHIATDSLETVPEVYSPFCRNCGKETISNCAHCDSPIRGRFVSIYDRHPFGSLYRRPNNCHNCGKQFPWVGLATQSARKTIDYMRELTPQEKAEFKELLDDLVAETPSTPVSTLKANQMLKKVSPVLVDAFKQIVIGVVLESIKHKIFT